MDLSVEVYRDKDNTYVASCPKLDVWSCGETINKAVSRLREIVNFYIEAADELGLSLEELCGANVEIIPTGRICHRQEQEGEQIRAN